MASNNNILQSKTSELTPEVALSSHRTFYAKKWQQNGYYPIYKFVWSEEQNGYEQFVQKTSGWHSWGVENLHSISNCNWWMYIFTHNGYILSFNEMTDNSNYNEY